MGLSFRRISQQWARFSEKQGFPLIVTICVAVITATALWNDRTSAPSASPTPAVNRDVSAAQLLQESLHHAATPTPSPTNAPCHWRPPLKEFTVIRGFDMCAMQQSGVTGVWSIHPGVDIAAEPGEPVCAMAEGTILSHGEDALLGVWFRVDHSGTEALYAGMAAAADFPSNGKVEAGTILGFVGRGPLDESDLGAHLHLEAAVNGTPIDPLSLWTVTSP